MDRRRFLPSYHYEDNTDGVLLESVGKPLRDYKIYGNSIQDGTPSPEEPVEIQSVGDKTRNLFDESILNKFADTLTTDKEWVMKNFAGVIEDGIAFKENTRYTLAFTAKQTAGNPRLIFKYTDGTSSNIGTWQLAAEYTTYIGTSAANKTIAYIGMEYGSTGYMYIKKGSIFLTEGVYTVSTMPEYEPYGYKVPVKVDEITHNIYLDEPLRKVGEYADYIDFSNQCVVRNVRCLSLDGSDDEVIVLQSTNSYGISNFYLDGLSDMALSEDCVMCNRLSRQTTNVANTMTEGFRFVITTSTYPYMRISSERVSTVADFRAWLSDNVVSFAYATNAPIIEPIELPKIPTGKGTINITVGTDVHPYSVVWQYYRR